jgi:hypothetical protein
VHDVLVSHEPAAVDPAEAVLIGHLAAGEGALPAVTDEEGERACIAYQARDLNGASTAAYTGRCVAIAPGPPHHAASQQ